ncbi:MAG: type III pantothenate kinase [Nitrospirae bacterium]|nr:type III pantothenate kinase [Nitrospirota bacterium]
MLLAVDIGNTNIVLGVYNGKKLSHHWRIDTDRHKTADEYRMLIKSLLDLDELGLKKIKSVIISCVVPPLLTVFEEISKNYLNVRPIIVNHKTKTGIKICYKNPSEVGADRIVNAVAAYHEFGGPVIIIDFGTATTFCVVSSKGEYLGGVIVPGITISAEALFEKAAKLPAVELIKPKSVIGKDTISSMQSGIIYGYAGMVDAIVERIKKETGYKNPMIVATGGLSGLIAPETKSIKKIMPLLTLDGLRLIYERNR